MPVQEASGTRFTCICGNISIVHTCILPAFHISEPSCYAHGLLSSIEASTTFSCSWLACQPIRAKVSHQDCKRRKKLSRAASHTPYASAHAGLPLMHQLQHPMSGLMPNQMTESQSHRSARFVKLRCQACAASSTAPDTATRRCHLQSNEKAAHSSTGIWNVEAIPASWRIIAQKWDV